MRSVSSIVERDDLSVADKIALVKEVLINANMSAEVATFAAVAEIENHRDPRCERLIPYAERAQYGASEPDVLIFDCAPDYIDKHNPGRGRCITPTS